MLANGYIDKQTHPKTGLQSGYLLNDKGINYYLNGEFKSDLSFIKRIFIRINAETIIKIATFIMALSAFASELGMIDINVCKSNAKNQNSDINPKIDNAQIIQRKTKSNTELKKLSTDTNELKTLKIKNLP